MIPEDIHTDDFVARITEAIEALEPMRVHDGAFMVATPIHNAIALLQELHAREVVAAAEVSPS